MADTATKSWTPCADGCLGWHVFNDTEIQRCDSADRFKHDDDAARHVEESYAKLLDLGTRMLALLQSADREDAHPPENPVAFMDELQAAIVDARGGK